MVSCWVVTLHLTFALVLVLVESVVKCCTGIGFFPENLIFPVQIIILPIIRICMPPFSGIVENFKLH